MAAYRKNRERLSQPGDDIGNKIFDSWFGLPHRVLVEHFEFPTKHWLEIDCIVRAQKAAGPLRWTRNSVRGAGLKYTGPQPADFHQLKAQVHRWQEIEKGTDQLRKAFEDAKKRGSLCDFLDEIEPLLPYADDPLVVGGKTLQDWRLRLADLPVEELYHEANALRLACRKELERYHRLRQELIVYKIDWTARPEELLGDFKQWLEINRVHEPRRRSGGHAPKAVELLKALGAKRLLKFFRKHQGALPRPYSAQQLHAALADFTRDQRQAAGRPAKPLYAKASGWNEAERIAISHLKCFSLNSGPS